MLILVRAGTDEKLVKARQLGAYEVVNHTTEDLPARVKEFTKGRGMDVVVEHVGTATWERSLRCLVRGGRLVTCGATAGGTSSLDLNMLFGRHLSLLGSWMGRRAELVEVLRFVADGRLKPVVDSVVPLAEARRAHERIEARQHFGKVVLTP